jgi:hypothetical protein
MASSQFINIPEIGGLFNSKSASTNEPFVYKIPVTYLQNLSPNHPMIIDSCSNIVLQARNNNHVRVNNKMGIGLDPSSAYSLHVLGDVCIDGNLISNNLNDIYTILDNFIFGTGYCGTITLFNKSIYDISFRVSWNPGSLSQGQEYLPNYVSVNSIDGSTNYIISKFARLADRSSKLFLNTKLDYNSFVNESLVNYSYVNIQLNNSLVTSISSEFFDNDSKHRIIVDISNFDNIENIPITINYNPLYKGFFGTFALGNKTAGTRFDYSYNYLSISGSTFNSIIQTLSGQALINNSINSINRLANQNTPLNLSLVIYNGYDISVNALSSSIVGISNNILTSPRLFNTSNNINYNYNIIPLTSYLVNGNIGLSFEMYITGFFGTFALGNKTADTIIEYNYNYISIGGSIYTNNASRFDLIIQKTPPTNSFNTFGQNSTKFAKTTNINNNGTFKAAIGALSGNRVYYWTGTTTNNELILLTSPSTALNLGQVVAIDNAGQYIVSGGYVSNSSVNLGGRIWSTTSPNNPAIINYPFLGSVGDHTMSAHISGNGQRVFVGSYLFNKIYAFSHTNLSLTQIGGAITCNVTDDTTTYTRNGFASDNNANYLITSARNYNSGTGFIVMYHFDGSTWIQSGSVFYGTAVNNNFGTSIDMNCGSGEWTCAGAPNATTPYVKIYKRNTITNAWTEFQTLNGTNGSGFGTSVSFNELGSNLYVTTTNAQIFYYTRLDNNGLFTLTFTIPVQEPSFKTIGQWVSTNSSGTQVILVKCSNIEAKAYYFENTGVRLNGGNLIINTINSINRLAYADAPLNLSLVIADGYDISVNALPSAIVGISNNILTSPRLFNISNIINYNYNIIPLSSYLFGGTIGLSFELYKTGFFGTFALGNKTTGTRFDYSYNYLSISGSTFNSIIQTLSGSDFSNILINSNSRLANQNTPLNLSLVIYNGYDISINALPNAIVGISNNILTNGIRTFDISNINYNYNIIPLTSYLFGGTIGLSFEMYRTGFFGAIVLTNNGGSAIDYSYNYISINSSTIYSPLISLNNGSSNTRTISGELRLRDASNQIAMNIRTASSEADISYSINGGTINTFVITTISSYKHSNFNILPNINNLVNGTLTFNVLSIPVPGPTASITTTAPDNTIVNGTSTTITPVFTNATTVTINGNVTVEEQAITSNVALTVSPTTTTTYTLLVTNSVGVQEQDSVTIYVSQPPPSNSGFNGNIQVIASGYRTNSVFVKLFIYADGTPRFEGTLDTDTYISIGTQLLSEESILYIYAEGTGGTAVTSYELKQYGGSTQNITSESPQTIDGNNYKGYTIANALNDATLVVYASLIDYY